MRSENKDKSRQALIGGVPEGLDAQVFAESCIQNGMALFVAKDDVGLSRMSSAINFFAPELEVLRFPAWDCLPYDRVSPKPEIVNVRINTLSKLLERDKKKKYAVITTISALLQKVPPKIFFEKAKLRVNTTNPIDPKRLINFLNQNGFFRVETVMEPGEFAFRGGLLDVFISQESGPHRLDFFGDQIETIRSFDPNTQRSTLSSISNLEELEFKPVSEIILNESSIAQFRSKYRSSFGKTGEEDPLYQAISSGHRHIGMEHWLPFFWDRLETFFDYFADN